jgi:hypothetical protein
VSAYEKDLEYMEMFSYEEIKGEFYIREFFILAFAEQTSTSISFYLKEYRRVKKQILSSGRKVGCIHTHLDYEEAVPSLADWKGTGACDEGLMGICSLWSAGNKIKSSINYWIPELPCKKIYN